MSNEFITTKIWTSTKRLAKQLAAGNDETLVKFLDRVVRGEEIGTNLTLDTGQTIIPLGKIILDKDAIDVLCSDSEFKGGAYLRLEDGRTIDLLIRGVIIGEDDE